MDESLVISTLSGPIRSVYMKGVRDPMYIRSALLQWIEKIARPEKEYELRRITEQRYRELKEKYEKEILKIELES